MIHYIIIKLNFIYAEANNVVFIYIMLILPVVDDYIVHRNEIEMLDDICIMTRSCGHWLILSMIYSRKMV